MSGAIQKAAVAFGLIDFDAIADTILRHRAEIDEYQQGLGRALARIGEIEQEIEGYRKPDVTTIADAFIDGNTSAVRRLDENALRDEKLSIGAGIVELRRRIEVATRAIDTARKSGKKAAGPLLDDVAEEIEADAIRCMQQLAELYAMTAALLFVSDSVPIANLERKLRVPVDGGRGNNSTLIPNMGPIPVPDEIAPIATVLVAAEAKGAIQMPTAVPRPEE